MDLFLRDRVLLANKNNIIKISLGKKKGENIFDANIKTDTIKNIISKIKKCTEFNVKLNSYTKEVYIKNNEYFTINRNDLTYDIYNLKQFYLDQNFLVKNIEITRDEFIIPTYNKYHSIENKEILDIKINNQFIVQIENNENNHCLNIVISKPVKLELLNNAIDIIKTSI